MYNIEYCDPFDQTNDSYWMKIEHLGRYLWACDVLKSRGKNKKVADIACANGYGTRLLSEVSSFVLGVDRNQKYLSSCSSNEKITFLCQDLDEGFPQGSLYINYDAIVCFETLEHVKYPDVVLSAFSKMLNDDGLLLLSVPNICYERFDENGCNLDSYHLHVFTKEMVFSLLQRHGFQVESLFGQDIPNRIVTRINNLKNNDPSNSLIKKSSTFLSDKPDDLFCAASLLGYPEQKREEESYSIIYLCSKTKSKNSK